MADHPAPGVLTRVRRRLSWGRTRRLTLTSVGRIDRHGASIRSLADDNRRLLAENEDLARRVEDHETRLKEAEWKTRVRGDALTLRGKQIAVLEERLTAFETRLEGGSFVADDDETAQARSLLDEVRAEHARARVQLRMAATYEERLRRVEESIAELGDSDIGRLL